MDRYLYKCVPVPRHITVDEKGSIDEAILAYENIINKMAVEGFEYVGPDSIFASQYPGCWRGLMGHKKIEIDYKIIIFRRALKI